MSYVLAIDVGTSFTAAAMASIDPPAARIPESLPLGLRGTAVPSVVYYPAEGPLLFGEAAERRGLDSPDRVIREFKRRVGDEVPISVGTLQLPAEDVFATMARWVVARAEERQGAPPSRIVLTHPASWGAHRTQRVVAALAAAGLPDVTLLSEPAAAALHYAAQVRVDDGSIIAVYDLGGGTFDTAVLKKADAGHFDLLGRPEGIEALGGADFDAAVLRHVSGYVGGALANLDLSVPGVRAALARLRRECVEAKEALSSDSEASIAVLLPGIQKQVRLVRSEFEDMIREPVQETLDALERSLQGLGLESDDLSAVLLVGGSSRIPLVAQLISEQLDRPVAVDADPKSSICLGAALAALRAQPEAAVVLPGTGGNRRASWSRTPGAAGGSPAGGGGGPGVHSGLHGQRATVRLTAVAAAATLLTVFSATAAQGPGGLGSLTAVFTPPAAGTAAEPAAADSGSDGAAQAGAAGAFAGSAGVRAPATGVEASARQVPGKPASAAGIEAVASAPRQRPDAGAPASAGEASSGGEATGSISAGAGDAASDPTQSSGGSTSGAPDEPATTSPDPVSEPTVEPVADPVSEPPAPDPTTTEPTPTEPPATEPTPTEPPATEPEPMIEPTTGPEPMIEPPPPEPTAMAEPSPEPAPTTDPPPEPTSTETAASFVTEPVG